MPLLSRVFDGSTRSARSSLARLGPRRAGRALVTAGVTALLTTGITVAVAPAASAAPTDDPGAAAAGWLARSLLEDAEGSYVNGQFGPDAGLTADTVLALDSAGVAQDASASAAQWLQNNVATYISGDDPAEWYAGPSAKLVLVAEERGADPTAFGGTDLVAGLLAREQANGRFSDQSQYGDYSNGITQSLAVLALERATATGPSANAVDFLAEQQCPDGGFPLVLDAEPCASDVDTTGYATQALLAVAQDDAASAALDWLESVQGADGSFAGSPPTATPNANSTGLAAQALVAGDRDASAALDWLTSLQVGCDGAEADRGRIAYDPASSGDALRATTQAIPALAEVPLLQVTAGGDPAAPTLNCGTAPTSGPTQTAQPTAPGTGQPVPSAASTTTHSAAAPTGSSGKSSGSDQGGPRSSTATSGRLADTGAPAAVYALLGIAALGVGAVTIALSRRRAEG